MAPLGVDAASPARSVADLVVPSHVGVFDVNPCLLARGMERQGCRDADAALHQPRGRRELGFVLWLGHVLRERADNRAPPNPKYHLALSR